MGLNLRRYFTSADKDLPPAYLKRCLKYLDNLYGIKHHNKKKQKKNKSASSQAGGPAHKESGFKHKTLLGLTIYKL